MSRKVIGFVLSLIMAMSINPTAFAKEQSVTEKKQSYALNSYTGQQIEELNGFLVTDNRASFVYSGRNYTFDLSKLSMDNSDNIKDANCFSGISGNLVCNIVEYNGNYCIQVIDRAKSIAERKNDVKNNFTIVSSNKIIEQIDEVAAKLHSENMKIEANLSVANSGLHVYASTLSVPFLISGGSAEGWCNATLRENSQYAVSSLRYVIAYNWPSDGISLWYDYMNSVDAYQSPVWPSSQYTDVGGSWTINSYTGAFVAQATVSVLVRGFPLMWTIYDVSKMDGTHI